MRDLRERWTRAQSSEDFAWTCLVTNMVGVPGLGTLMARRWEAAPQLALAIVGGVLMTWWLVAFAIAELRTMTIPPPGGPDIGLVLWGIGLFGLAWLWALVSGVALVRAARHDTPPPRT